jgi:Mor family transcriptional regulator
MTTSVRMSKSAELLSDMADHISHLLTEKGVDRHSAESMAIDVVSRLSSVFGGQGIYFPQGVKNFRDEKAQKIFSEFESGLSISELAQKHKHSIQWIYRLLSNERKRHCEARNQKYGKI